MAGQTIMASLLKEQVYTVVADPQVNYLLERVLGSAGYTVTAVPDQSSAERLLQIGLPAVMLIGESLPDGSGLDLARRSLERNPNLPVLLLGTQENPGMLREVLRAGVLDYLCLPLKSEQILQSVNAAVIRSQRRRDWAVLESRRATASLQRRVDELETLAHLGRTVTSTLDLDSVLPAVVPGRICAHFPHTGERQPGWQRHPHRPTRNSG
jgi:two-component system NtrC family sensor kinase